MSTKRGGLPVQKRMCATCIYRPESPLDLRKLEADVADPYLEGHFKGSRICHHSDDAVCRGFWERHKDHFDAGQLAQRLGVVNFVEDDTLRKDTDMSNKTALKNQRRKAEAARPAYHFHSRYAGMTPEEIEAAVHTRIEAEVQRKARGPAALGPKPTVSPKPPKLERVSLPRDAKAVVVLGDNPVGTITEGSLREAVLKALREGTGSMTLEELSRALKQNARPVVAKLAQRGWVRMMAGR